VAWSSEEFAAVPHRAHAVPAQGGTRRGHRSRSNASYVKGRIRGAIHGAPEPVRWLVFDAEVLTHVDAGGVDALTELIGSLQQQQITFVLSRGRLIVRSATAVIGAASVACRRARTTYPRRQTGAAASPVTDDWRRAVDIAPRSPARLGPRRDPHHQTVHLLRVMTTHPSMRNP
jgi:hypothetical protein